MTRDFITGWRLDNNVKIYIDRRLNPIYKQIREALVTLNPEPLTHIDASPVKYVTLHSNSDRVEGWAENYYMMLKRLAVIMSEALTVHANNPNETVPVNMKYGFQYIGDGRCTRTFIDIEVNVPKEYEELARDVIRGIDKMWGALQEIVKEKGWADSEDSKVNTNSCEYHPCGGTYTVINGVLMIKGKNYRKPSLTGDCYGYNTCTETGHTDVIYTEDFTNLVKRINPRDEAVISGYYRFIDGHGGIIYFKTKSGISGSVSVDYDLSGLWLVIYDKKDERYKQVNENMYTYINDILTDITLEYPDWEGWNVWMDCA